jgi:hypothetical protein
VKRLPTDFEILNTIYERYYDEFPSFVRSEPTLVPKSWFLSMFGI